MTSLHKASTKVETRILEAQATESENADDYWRERVPADIELTAEDYEFLKIKVVHQPWYKYFSPTDTPDERKLIVKLDLLILIYLFLSSFVKTLDSSAVPYAYVSGMKEDLKMFGNQLTYQGSCYMAGFIVGQIPLTMLATKLPIHIYLPAMDVVWAMFTLFIFKIKSYQQLYALRFCTGLFGSFFFPTVQFIIGSWYKKTEIALRSALYFTASQAGSMATGYIQAAAYRNLSGKAWLEGWQWLYVLAFIITVPVSLYGYFTLPGLPESLRPRRTNHSRLVRLFTGFSFLNEKERKLARLRMIREGRPTGQKFQVSVLLRCVKGYRFWVLVVFAIFFSQADGISSNSGLTLWLDAENYSSYQVNVITTVIPAVTIVFSLLNAIIVDSWKNVSWSYPAIIAYVAILNMIAGIILVVWNVSKGGILFAFFLSGTADSIAAVLYSWANLICSDNALERALTLSSMNTLGNTFAVWVPLFVWKTVDAPRYVKGYAYNIALDAMMLLMLPSLVWLHRSQKHAWASPRFELKTLQESVKAVE
ncbi:LAMI_0E05094g1_1 [Lachancea mirantina]|uniref:LAMI_0E05094g1_1 n=1 Tax=Lachancea mirantina TaxID=1230905 RepID=A0A1G4JKW3_9SACH|nr:LAMI_0E05094g1_1 [Lachancea mirantina]